MLLEASTAALTLILGPCYTVLPLAAKNAAASAIMANRVAIASIIIHLFHYHHSHYRHRSHSRYDQIPVVL